jgi:hypothetical protein
MAVTSIEDKLRAWWWRRQGLDGSLAGRSPASILERCGWARSVGGVGPYITLFSRGGVAREAVDAAAAKLEIHELPSARGCAYVLPASDFALGLKVGQAFGHESEMKVARKLGVTDAEIEKLCEAVLAALAKEPLDPADLRDRAGNAARGLGPEGKKKGLTTTLPLALGKLQSLGEIRRVPTNGRLDQQRYRYALWRPNPLKGFTVSPEEAYSRLARRFFAWIAPATVAEFQTFAGLGVKAAQAAVAPLKLEPLAKGDERLLFPEDRAAFEDFKVPAKTQFVLTSGFDSLALLRRDLKALVAPEDLKVIVQGERGKIEMGGLAYLPNHAIFDRGRLVGLWEYDPARREIVWMAFGAASPGIAKAVKETEEYVREQLGDARSFSLDSPESRVPKILALREAKAERG